MAGGPGLRRPHFYLLPMSKTTILVVVLIVFRVVPRMSPWHEGRWPGGRVEEVSAD
jgi:hypothetical protein